LKNVNTQDLSAPKTAEELRSRYNLGVTKNMTAKRTSSGTALGIGKKASIGKGLDVAGSVVTDGGFFDASGNEIFSVKTITAAQLDEMTLPPGQYNVEQAVTGLPGNYHHIYHMTGYHNPGFHAQLAVPYASGNNKGVYLRVSAGSVWGNWNHLLSDLDAAASGYAANTVVKRDENGNISAKNMLNFANNDGLYYNDTDNAMYLMLDGTNSEIIHGGNLASAGTWTPTLASHTGTNPTATYSYRVGTWYRMGDLIYIECHIKCKISSAGTGYCKIAGLPVSLTSYSQAIGTAETYGCTNLGNGNHVTGIVEANYLRLQDSGGGGALAWVSSSSDQWVRLSGAIYVH